MNKYKLNYIIIINTAFIMAIIFMIETIRCSIYISMSPYIPDKTKSYEENAKAQIHEFMVAEYISKIVAEEITIDDVPEDCKADLKADVEAALAT